MFKYNKKSSTIFVYFVINYKNIIMKSILYIDLSNININKGEITMYVCARIKKIFIFLISGLFAVSIFLTVKNSERAVFADVTKENEDEGIFFPVLMYHSILKNESRQGDYVISPEVFENDMLYLKNHGYNTVTMQELINYVYEDVPLPQNPVMITFDDGFYNNMVYAVPILQKYEMKAVISIVGVYTEQFSESKDKNPAYSYLTWDDITELSSGGTVEIGNHTYNMHKSDTRKGCGQLWNETDEEYVEALTEDVMTLQDKLEEKCGVTPKVFAYPFGNISRPSIQALKDMGFLGTFICYESPNYITKSPNTLFGINRYNRPSKVSTEEYMNKALSK